MVHYPAGMINYPERTPSVEEIDEYCRRCDIVIDKAKRAGAEHIHPHAQPNDIIKNVITVMELSKEDARNGTIVRPRDGYGFYGMKRGLDDYEWHGKGLEMFEAIIDVERFWYAHF